MSADRTISSDIVLPEALRDELARPIGPIIGSHEVAGYIRGCGKLYAVGDMVAVSLMEMGIQPDVMIFDYRTQRGPCEEEIKRALQKTEGITVKVDNPPGKITPDLWNAVLKASRSDKKIKIEVKGEEDLASLVCIELASQGDCVIYGIPDEGVSVIRIDDEVKQIIKNILMRMASSQ